MAKRSQDEPTIPAIPRADTHTDPLTVYDRLCLQIHDLTEEAATDLERLLLCLARAQHRHRPPETDYEALP